MIAWELGGQGIETLVQLERPDPEPHRGQVLVRVRAVSLNYRDLIFARSGAPAPIIPASDGAGIVVALGPGVTRWHPGDRVVANFFQTWVDGAWHSRYGASALGGAIDGMLAELVVLEEDALVQIPEGWSFEEAATLPCAGVTAWNALYGDKVVRPGDLVVTQGTGGVSIFALQLAVAAGAEVAATSSSDHKLGAIAELGANVRVNYRSTPDWAQEVRTRAGRGADHVVEVTGQLNDSLRVAAPNGTVVVIGTTLGVEGGMVEVRLREIREKCATIRGVYVGPTAMLSDLVRAMAVAGTRPVIDSIFPFDNVVDAYQALLRADHIGKIVIGISSSD
jgi:NADPH:quinone reductase-like Zn-dependent oxidoreductase